MSFYRGFFRRSPGSPSEDLGFSGQESGAESEVAIARYADFLECHCHSAPYNWFNFCDFWQAPQAYAGGKH
jgi:predicted LPLAT superfamily acyltransferase